MSAVRQGVASVTPNRLSPLDWLCLAVFASPILAALIHSMTGGL